MNIIVLQRDMSRIPEETTYRANIQMRAILISLIVCYILKDKKGKP